MAEFNPGSIFARLSSLLIIPFTILRHMASSSSTQQDSEGATGLDYGPNANLPGPSPVNPNLVVSDDIRAFRTTLSFLEHLQTKEMEKLPDRTYGNSPSNDKELQFYSSMAMVSVRNLDVVTVGSNARFTAIQGHPHVENPASESQVETIRHQGTGSPSALKLILASEEDQQRPSTPIKSQLASDQSYMTYTMHILKHPLVFVNNYLRGDARNRNPINTVTGPELRDTRKPDDVESESDEDVIKFLDRYPLDVSPGTQFSLEEHLWIIQHILAIRHEKMSRKRDRLLRYIATSCVSKIYRRLRCTPWSREYTNKLQEICSQGPAADPELGDPEPPESTRRRREQNGHDHSFLMNFVLVNGGQERKLSNRQLAANDSDNSPAIINIPNIVAKAIQLTHTSTAPDGTKHHRGETQLYDASTHQEIGQISHYCVEQLALSLVCLQNRLHIRDSTRLTAEEKESLQMDKRSTPTLVDDIVTFGVALCRLSQGSALRQYLKNMNTLLQPTSNRSPMPIVVDEEGKHAEEGDDEQFHEDKPMWQRYQSWFELVSSHFWAVFTICKFFDSYEGDLTRPVAMRILVPPSVDTEMMCWRTLLNGNGTYFPTETIWNGQGHGKIDAMINEDMKKRLEAAAKVYSEVFVTQLRRTKVRDAAALKSLQDMLKNLVESKVNTLVEHADAASSIIENILKGNLDSHNVSKEQQHAQLTKALEPLKERIGLFKFLNAEKEDDYRNGVKRTDFKGTLHSEVTLATLLNSEVTRANPFPEVCTQLREVGHVLGVSKRCCPVCRHLLALLIIGEEGDREYIDVEGAHKTISSCTLPPWLLPRIVTTMRIKFGEQLRKELIWFVGKNIHFKPSGHVRVPSADSASLNSDVGGSLVHSDTE